MTITIDGKQIRSVTTQGLTYVDNDGIEQFIDFQQCYENYLADRLSPEAWETHKQLNHKSDEDWDSYVQRGKAFKYVGNRQVMSPP